MNTPGAGRVEGVVSVGVGGQDLALQRLSLFRDRAYYCVMEPTEYVCWKDQDHWLGCLKEHPDYWTQGESLEDLRAHLHDLECDLRLLRAQVFC